jgi:hypothetical protein
MRSVLETAPPPCLTSHGVVKAHERVDACGGVWPGSRRGRPNPGKQLSAMDVGSVEHRHHLRAYSREVYRVCRESNPVHP